MSKPFELRVLELASKGRWSQRQASIIVNAQMLEEAEASLELRKAASGAAKGEGRTYLLGLPVSVTMFDDGSVKVEVDLCEVSTEIRSQDGVQYGDEDSVAALTMEDVQSDAIAFEQTYDAEKREPLGRNPQIIVDWN